jgi:hypothetical protein
MPARLTDARHDSTVFHHNGRFTVSFTVCTQTIVRQAFVRKKNV